METSSNALIEIWKGKLFFLGRQRISDFWLFTLISGFILVIMPTEPYARSLFLQKALGIFAITVIMSFAHISNSKIGQMHFGDNAFQLYVLMINLFFLSFFAFFSLFFLYSSVHFFMETIDSGTCNTLDRRYSSFKPNCYTNFTPPDSREVT